MGTAATGNSRSRHLAPLPAHHSALGDVREPRESTCPWSLRKCSSLSPPPPCSSTLHCGNLGRPRTRAMTGAAVQTPEGRREGDGGACGTAGGPYACAGPRWGGGSSEVHARAWPPAAMPGRTGRRPSRFSVQPAHPSRASGLPERDGARRCPCAAVKSRPNSPWEQEPTKGLPVTLGWESSRQLRRPTIGSRS